MIESPLPDSWRFLEGQHGDNPDGCKVEGTITLYRVVRSDPPPLSAFFTDFWGRGRRHPMGGREKRWPLLLHSLSMFNDPVKAALIARENHIGDFVARLVLETAPHGDVSVCLSPGRNPNDPATYHFDVFGPPETLRKLVMRVDPLMTFLR